MRLSEMSLDPEKIGRRTLRLTCAELRCTAILVLSVPHLTFDGGIKFSPVELLGF